MEGVRTARGRGLDRSHRGGRFTTVFQSPFAPVSNNGAGARGGVWVVRTTWEDSPPDFIRRLPPPHMHNSLLMPRLPPSQNAEAMEVEKDKKRARREAALPVLDRLEIFSISRLS